MIEYCVGDATFATFDEAAGHAVARAASGKDDVCIDVIVFGEKGAFEYGGDYGVERYREDPDASVFDRIEVRCNVVGRVP